MMDRNDSFEMKFKNVRFSAIYDGPSWFALLARSLRENLNICSSFLPSFPNNLIERASLLDRGSL